MFGFGKAKEKKGEEKSLAEGAHFVTIPESYYGGKNPNIFEEVESHPVKSGGEELSRKAPATLPLQAKIATPEKKSKKRWALIAGVLLFAMAIGGIIWYYARDARKDTSPASSPQGAASDVVVPAQQNNSSATTTPIFSETPSSTSSSTLPLDTRGSGEGIDFPKTLLIDSADLDADELTDLEEEIFGTDSGVWDSDGDGYYDGQEVAHLYSPTGEAPTRLVDSGRVREYLHPTLGYRLYYPSDWAVGTVDTAGSHLLFSAVTGDYIELQKVPKEKKGETFDEWFAREARGEQRTEVASITTPFGVKGFRRADSLVAYFDDAEAVFVFLYHPGTTGFIPFRGIMEMAFMSFRATRGTDSSLPPQQELPKEGEASGGAAP